MPSRLIAACDGTWESADVGSKASPTNVANLCRALTYTAAQDETSYQQIVFYQSGIGTGALTPIQRLVTATFGLGLEQNSQETYAFLANNYNPGDEIFLFGFSRGAYTVRSVAGLIGALGILTREGMQHWKPIYALFSKVVDEAAFKKSLSQYIATNNLHDTKWRTPPEEVEIKAIGCWETVGELGVPDSWLSRKLHLNREWKFLNTRLPLRTAHAFQALALDEHRREYSPTLWWSHSSNTYSISDRTVTPELVQCWFPGYHKDVGGGYRDHKIQDLALAWLLDQLISRDLLSVDAAYVRTISANTRDKVEPGWNKNPDPFKANILALIFWSLLGSKRRTPGRYPRPKDVKPGSTTNEWVHYSVREKKDQTGKKDPVSLGDLSEFPLPQPDSLQAWLSGDWLMNQKVRDSDAS